MTDTPCRVSADLRADQLREDRRERAAMVECSRGCGRRVHESDIKDYDWIECKRHECHNVLCVDCQGELDKDSSWFGCLEAVYEDEYCSPWCVVLDLRAAKARAGR